MSEQKRSSLPFWVAAGVSTLPLLYLLSMGPISAIKYSVSPEVLGILHAYEWPFAWSYWNGPEWWRATMDFYLELWG